jgi:rubredoxin
MTGKGSAGFYRCPNCGYGKDQNGVCLYDEDILECPECGHKELEFIHYMLFGGSHHWVLIDCATGKLIGDDPCEIRQEQR